MKREAASVPHLWMLDGLDEPALENIAGWLSLIARPGDVITLEGDLGAGKTTFARAFIRAAGAEPELEVPSPTFPIIQDYALGRFFLFHADLYRLSGATEVMELGLFEETESRVTLVEWPDRALGLLPADRIAVRLADAQRGERRAVGIAGFGGAVPRVARLEQLMRFAASHGWRTAPVHVAGDASVRAYARLAQADRPDLGPVLLMDSPAPPAGPPLVSGKTYRQTVHSADDIGAFFAVSRALRAAGVVAPAVIAADRPAGFAVVEDFGNTGFAEVLADGVAMADVYAAATHVLIALRAHPPAPELVVPEGGPPHTLHVFDLEAMCTEAALLLDWHYPEAHHQPVPPHEREAFFAAFDGPLREAAADTSGWVLRDFHSPNLHWLPDELTRIGVIDFQDAMRGSPAYDLASLLQDARVDVPAWLEATLLNQYCEACQNGRSGFDAAAFRRAYATLGAQRAIKILGIFVRLWRRDGKPQYLAHCPRLWRVLERNLAAPHLAALKTWFDRCYPEGRRDTPG